MSLKKQIYLPGLNGVRFFAAFLVIIDHMELFKGYLSFPSFWSEDYSSYLGNFGVTIFFTLSGFLITYLLREERKIANGNINLKNFYIRRILRIWPLYYLILILSFFVLPHLNILYVPAFGEGVNTSALFTERLLLFTFLLPNVAFVYYPLVPFGNVLWSVGVEEQFYLFWPVLLKKIRSNIFTIIVVCIGIYMVVKFGIVLLSEEAGGGKAYMLMDKTRISCMLIGAMASGFTNRHWLKSKWLQWSLLLAFFLMMMDLINFKYYALVKNETNAMVIAVLLINISVNSNSIFRLENKVLDYLGKISYGLYVYHTIIAVLVLKSLTFLYPFLPYAVWSALVLAATLTGTVLVSHISYFFFEKKLLNRKEKYSVVVSGDQVSHENLVEVPIMTKKEEVIEK